MIELSVIIPTFNRAVRLRACLAALVHQTHPADEFEIIVVNDGSTDGTAALLKELDTPFELRVIQQARGGQTRARNRGAEAARGRCLLFLDDDVRAGPRLIAAHLEAQQQGGGVIGVGPLTNAPASSDEFSAHFSARWNEHYLHLERGRAPSWRDCYSGNLSVPAQAFRQVNGFATDLPTWFDLDLGYRLTQQGLPVVYVHEAGAVHDDPKNARRLLAELEAEGRIAPEFHRRHPPTVNSLYANFWELTPRARALDRVLERLNPTPFSLLDLGRWLPAPWRGPVWFRFLEHYAYWRGVRSVTSPADWARITSRTPILMYHAFGTSSERPSRFVVPIAQFEDQLRWLGQNSYQVLSCLEYVSCLRQGYPPPPRSVILTLDDGYRDNYQLAWPLLQRYKMPATVFIVSTKVGKTNDWDPDTELRGRPLADWSELQAMVDGGIGIGAHSRTHPRLPDLDDAALAAELDGSRAELSSRLGLPIQLFAYPYGESDPRVQAAAEQHGFLGSCTAKHGLNTVGTPMQALRRIEIHGTDSLRQFASKIQGR